MIGLTERIFDSQLIARCKAFKPKAWKRALFWSWQRAFCWAHFKHEGSRFIFIVRTPFFGFILQDMWREYTLDSFAQKLCFFWGPIYPISEGGLLYRNTWEKVFFRMAYEVMRRGVVLCG